MKIIDLKCPKCGGELHISEGRKDCFCEYCGSHLFLDEFNSVTSIQVFRDEAKLKELEMEELREKEFTRKEENFKKLAKKWFIAFIIYLASLFFLPKVTEGLLQRALAFYGGFGIIFVIFFGFYVLLNIPSDKKK